MYALIALMPKGWCSHSSMSCWACNHVDQPPLCCRCMKWRRMHHSTQAAHGFSQANVSFYCELHPERPDLTCNLPEDL